jgi:hypothetical protein
MMDRNPRASHSEAATKSLTTPSRESCAINPDYLAGVGPIVSVRHKTSPDRIIAHVIPFLRVALVAPQDAETYFYPCNPRHPRCDRKTPAARLASVAVALWAT